MTDVLQFCMRFLFGYVVLFGIMISLIRLLIPFNTVIEDKKKDLMKS
jgi:hypothetical protein